VVDANILAMTRGDGNAYNIGTGQGTNVNRIFGSLRDIIKYKWDAEHRAARPGEVDKISLECQKAYDGLGWSAQVGLEEGLERTADFFRKSARTAA
jgi:UDP-glucose 4-epimerase